MTGREKGRKGQRGQPSRLIRLHTLMKVHVGRSVIFQRSLFCQAIISYSFRTVFSDTGVGGQRKTEQSFHTAQWKVGKTDEVCKCSINVSVLSQDYYKIYLDLSISSKSFCIFSVIFGIRELQTGLKVMFLWLQVILDVPLARDPEIKLPLVILSGSPKPHQQKPEIHVV